MADERLRELERRAATGGPAHVVALQRERLRLGLLVPGKRLELRVDRDARRATFITSDRLLVQGTRDSLGLQVWDVTSTKEIAHVGPDDARLASISPDGQRVAFAHAIGVVGPDLDRLSRMGVCDLATGATSWDRALEPCVIATAWSPAGDSIACLGGDQTLLVLDAATGDERARWIVRPARAVAWRGAAQLVTAGCGSVGVWDVATGQEVARREGSASELECVAVAPNGSVAVTGGAQGALRVWDLGALEEVGRLEGHRNLITGVALSPYFRRALSCGADGTVRLWDLPSRSQVRKFVDLGAEQRRLQRPRKNGSRIASRINTMQDGVAFSPDGMQAASVNAGVVTVWTLPP